MSEWGTPGWRNDWDRLRRDEEELYGTYYEPGIERCLIQEFFRNNPQASACMISCPCPKCSVRM